MAPRSMAGCRATPVLRKRKAEASSASVEKNAERKYHDVEKEILECPICVEQFTPPVFQCLNGHAVCSACRAKIRQCPSCSLPVSTFIRNLLAERIAESLQVRCPYAHHGCNQMMKFKDAEEHWRSLCAYRPCPCPVPRCMHEGLKQTLALHLQEEHQVPTKTGCGFNSHAYYDAWHLGLESTQQSRFAILEDLNKKPQLLLHREVIEGLGEILFCTSFEDHSIKYNLKVMVQDVHGDYLPYTTIERACAVDIRKRNDWKKDGFLCSNLQKLTAKGTKLEICICRD